MLALNPSLVEEKVHLQTSSDDVEKEQPLALAPLCARTQPAACGAGWVSDLVRRHGCGRMRTMQLMLGTLAVGCVLIVKEALPFFGGAASEGGAAAPQDGYLSLQATEPSARVLAGADRRDASASRVRACEWWHCGSLRQFCRCWAAGRTARCVLGRLLCGKS